MESSEIDRLKIVSTSFQLPFLHGAVDFFARDTTRAGARRKTGNFAPDEPGLNQMNIGRIARALHPKNPLRRVVSAGEVGYTRHMGTSPAHHLPNMVGNSSNGTGVLLLDQGQIVLSSPDRPGW